jgi:hypothetical protein
MIRGKSAAVATALGRVYLLQQEPPRRGGRQSPNIRDLGRILLFGLGWPARTG